jgi:hypothetical protein
VRGFFKLSGHANPYKNKSDYLKVCSWPYHSSLDSHCFFRRLRNISPDSDSIFLPCKVLA